MSSTSKIESASNILSRILEYVAVITLIISVVLAFSGVIFRYFFGFSFGIMEEICRYSIVYGVFAYTGPLIIKGEHLKISIIHDMMKGQAKHINNLIINVVLLGAFIVLFFSSLGWLETINTLKLKTMSGSMLMAVPVFAVPVGMLIGCLYSALQIFIDIRNIRSFRQTPEHKESAHF